MFDDGVGGVGGVGAGVGLNGFGVGGVGGIDEFDVQINEKFVAPEDVSGLQLKLIPLLALLLSGAAARRLVVSIRFGIIILLLVGQIVTL